MARFFTVVRRLLNIINPQPAIGGLEVVGNLLQIALVKKGKLTVASVRLPPEAVAEGRIKDKALVQKAAVELHKKISDAEKRIYVVLDIPEQLVYTQIFSLPRTKRFAEAVRLNLQMVSPVDFSQVYSDWETIDSAKNNGQVEVLSAFASRAAVDEWIAVLSAANFGVAAVESGGLALARLFRLEPTLTKALVLRLTSDGMSFLIIGNGTLYFSHFVPWAEPQMTLQLLLETIIRESQRVVNFYRSHWPGNLDGIFYAAASVEVARVVEQALARHGAPIQSLKSFLKTLAGRGVPLSDEGGAAALSSALRGALPRMEDTMISLTAAGTEETFKRQELLNFIRVWRTTLLVILIFFLGAFAAADYFFINLENSIQSAGGGVNSAGAKELDDMVQVQRKVNGIVALVLAARASRVTPIPFLERLEDLAAASQVSLDRVFIQGDRLPIALNADAASEADIIAFKEKIAADPEIAGVDLPLSAISKGTDNRVSFTMTIHPAESVFMLPSSSTAVMTTSSAEASSTASSSTATKK